MSIRRLIVEIDPSTINVTEFCAQHGVSTWFFYDLRRRHAAEGDTALEPRSRAPRRVANKTPDDVEDAIVAERKRLVDAGLDAGAESIRFWLRDLPRLPSTSTIWRILVDRGFIVPEPRKAPKGSGRRFQADRANECWQIDDTSWALADGTGVKIFNTLDDCSRLAAACKAMWTCTGASSLDALAAAAQTFGWPERVQSDNAKAFREIVAEALAELGVDTRHSRPSHPQTNGKVERFHQTQKRWLAKQPPAATLDDLQAQLDWFRDFYNHQRPHRSLDRATPAHTWTLTPKAGPADRPLGLPTTIHTGTVTENGTLNAGHRYKISLGAAYRHQRALTVITGRHCHVFIDGRLVRRLTLDPTRWFQPLYDRPGHPGHNPRPLP